VTSARQLRFPPHQIQSWLPSVCPLRTARPDGTKLSCPVARCKLSRRQSATDCNNLGQSELFVVYRIISYWLHNWNLGQHIASRGSIAAIERLGLYAFRHSEHVQTSDFFVGGMSLVSSRIHFTPSDPTKRDSIVAWRRIGQCELGIGNATACCCKINQYSQTVEFFEPNFAPWYSFMAWRQEDKGHGLRARRRISFALSS